MDSVHINDRIINEYLDGELQGVTRHEVEDHLARCPACMGRVEASRRLFEGLESLPDIQLSRDLSHAVMSAIHAPQRSQMVPRLLLAAQIVLLVLILALLRPYFAERVASLPWETLRAQLETSVNAAMLPVLDLGLQELARLETLRIQAFESFRSAARLRLPSSLGWPWILLATLFWLTGNSLLLHPSIPRPWFRTGRE